MAVDHNNPQSRNEEILIATIDGNEYDKAPQSRMEELLLELKETIEEGGGGGTTNYNDLSNQPQIEGHTLIGNKSASDLGLATEDTVEGILDGQTIDSFGDVETALANKQNTLTAGNYISIANDGTINVTQGIGVYDVYSYKFEGRVQSTNYWTDIIKSKNGVQQSSTRYSNTQAATPINIDDRFTLKYGLGTDSKWHVTLLVDSNEHQAGEEITWSYNKTKDFTETFNVSQDSSTDLATKGDVNTAIAGKQDTLTFDDTPTDNSNNPVKSNGIYDALALKQDKTDNSLDTEAKTIVGAINEHEGDIGSLMSGLTNLDNEVNGDATTYPYADVITVEDAVPANLADCSVKVEPVQDLHGYDKPWVGGAGKNKLPMTVDGIKAANTGGTWSGNAYTANGVTFTAQTDNDGNVIGILVNGTAVQNTEFYVFSDTSNSCPFNGMLLNGCINGGDATYDLRVSDFTTTSTKQTTGDGEIINVTKTGQWRCSIMIRSGYVASNQMFYPMIRLATETDATFAPYTNICPITGHTEAVVTRSGENVAFNTISGKNINASGVIINADFDLKVAKVTSGVTYTAYTDDSNSVYAFYSANPASGSASYNNSRTEATVSNSCFEFTAPIDGYIAYRTNVGYDRTECAESSSIQQYTLALGDTIYGGTVDFDSGVMTVDRAYAEFNGSDDESWQVAYNNANIGISGMKSGDAMDGISNIFPTGTFIGAIRFGYNNNNIVYIQRVDTLGISDVEGWKTFLSSNNMQIVYPLATPFTVQLTPQQIQLLKGTNTLYASTGDISVTVNGVSGAIGAVQEQVNGIAEDVALKQNATDNNLQTTDKTIVGAINEHEGDIGSLMSGLIDVNSNLSKVANQVFDQNTPVYLKPNYRGNANANVRTIKNTPANHVGAIMTSSGIYTFKTNNAGNGFEVPQGSDLSITNEGNVYTFSCPGGWYTMCLFIFTFNPDYEAT